jgi:predicted ATP-grasp superfamily ATP-dependent carboligase
VARVLVTDGEQRAALAVVRSLGRAGHDALVCATGSRSLAGLSRHCAGRLVVPDPLTDPLPFVDALAAACTEHRVQLLLPIAEPAILAILEQRERFPGVRIPFPDAGTFRRSCDKAAVLEAAAIAGLHVPQQRIVTSPEFDVDDLEYPIVVKPARSVGEADGTRLKVGVRHAATAADLRSLARSLPPQAFPLLLQQRIVGPGMGVFLLVHEGRLIASFAHRRLREKPPAGGVSVYRESVAMDGALLRQSMSLLSRLGWDGVAMVEYKVDATTGRAFIMEINGRFWGSLQLAVDAGVDFPVILVEAALEGKTSCFTGYRTGVRSRWWCGDMDHVLARIIRSKQRLALPPDAPPLSKVLGGFAVLWRPGDRSEVQRLGDPLPGLYEIAQWFRGR